MFSVIIPAYNAASYIQQSIGSVLSQTVFDFEIIVVDDGSTDNTKDVVESIEDVRIRYIRQENGGVSAARNTGISNAKGEYVCFLDSDDLWKPHHLETALKMIKNFPLCGVYITGHEIRLNNGEVIYKFCRGANGIKQSNNVFEDIWRYGYFIATNSIICKTSVFDEVGMFEIGVRNGEDDDMWYRLFAYYSAVISSEITTTYIRENSRATISKIFVDDWVFLNRVEAIMADDSVSVEKKHYLNHLLEQRKLSFARDRILNGDKKTAIKILHSLNKKMVRPRKLLETFIALLIPYRLVASHIKNRDKKYYQE